MAVSFEIGEEFSSLDELEIKRKVFCESNFVDLYHRDSRTIENAIKRGSIKGLPNGFYVQRDWGDCVA